MEKFGVVQGEGDEPVAKEAEDKSQDPRHPVGTDLMSRMSRFAADEAKKPGGTPQGPVQGE